MPRYDFCNCGFVRCVWPSGRELDWHAKSAQGAAEARRLDAEERMPEANLARAAAQLSDRMDAASFEGFVSALVAIAPPVKARAPRKRSAPKPKPKPEPVYDYEPPNHCHCSWPTVSPPCSWCESGAGGEQ